MRLRWPQGFLPALAAYTAITAVASFPLLRRLTSAIPAGGDSWLYYWDLWWVHRAVTRFQNPFFTKLLHYPYGTSLYFHTLNLLPSVAAIPLIDAAGLAAAFNAIVFVSFVASAYATYALCHDALDSETGLDDRVKAGAAFVGGLVFAFSSYRFVHSLGHLDLVSTQLLPWVALLILRARNCHRATTAIGAGIVLSATFLTTPTYALFVIVFMAIVPSVDWVYARRTVKTTLKSECIVLTTFALVCAPVLIPMIMGGMRQGRVPQPEYDIGRFSVDLVRFVIPNRAGMLWRWLPPSTEVLGASADAGIETRIFLGYVPLIMGAVALVRSRVEKIWWISFSAFCALAVGPRIHIMGHDIAPWLIMPYAFLMHLPYGTVARVPARFAVMAMLCLAVLSAHGVAVLTQRLATSRRVVAITSLGFLSLGEHLVMPLPMMTVTPPAFAEIMARSGDARGVVEIPIPDDPSKYPIRMMYQTIHQKPMYGGYIARGLPPLQFDAIPGFAELKRLSPIDDIVEYAPALFTAIGRTALNSYDVGWIVIEKRLLDGAELPRAERMSESLADSLSAFEDSEVLIYRVNTRVDASVPRSIWLDTGWSYLEHDSRRKWRWMATQASLRVNAGAPATVSIEFDAQAYMVPRRIKLSVGDRDIDVIGVSPALGHFTTHTFRLSDATQRIDITSLDGTDRPRDDPRQLSVAFSDIKFIVNKLAAE
jgi:hypothetical protein